MRVCDFFPLAVALVDTDAEDVDVTGWASRGWSGSSEAGMENDAGGWGSARVMIVRRWSYGREEAPFQDLLRGRLGRARAGERVDDVRYRDIREGGVDGINLRVSIAGRAGSGGVRALTIARVTPLISFGLAGVPGPDSSALTGSLPPAPWRIVYRVTRAYGTCRAVTRDVQASDSDRSMKDSLDLKNHRYMAKPMIKTTIVGSISSILLMMKRCEAGSVGPRSMRQLSKRCPCGL